MNDYAELRQRIDNAWIEIEAATTWEQIKELADRISALNTELRAYRARHDLS